MNRKHDVEKRTCPEYYDRDALKALSRLPIEPWQNCWEDSDKIGISLLDQFKKYNEIFSSFLALNEVIIIPDSEINNEIIINKRISTSINNATTIMELQNILIVLNANQFRLRDNPTEKEFEAILLDYKKWVLREAVDINMHTLIDKNVKEARKKFKELKKEAK